MEEFPESYAKRSLLASLVVVGMGFSVLFPILAPLGREMKMNELQITSIIAVSSLTVFLSSPHWGRRSDRWGRKKVMLIGLFGFSFGTALFNSVLYAGLAGVLTGTTLWILLLVARFLHACAMSATMPAANAYMADITTPENRTRGMGAAGAANNIGTILGPAICLLSVISMLTPLWTMAVIAFCNGLFVLWFLPKSPHILISKELEPLRYTDPRILPFIIVGVVMFVGFAVVQQTMGFRFQDVLGLNATQTTATFALGVTLLASCSLTAQVMVVQRLNMAPFALLQTAIPLLIIAFLIMAFANNRSMLYLGMMVLGFGMGMAGPGFMAGASLSVSAEEQGSVAGVAGACGPLGFFIGPLVGGAMYQIHETLPYFFSAGMFTVLLFFMPWIGRRVKTHRNGARTKLPSSPETYERIA